MQFDKQAFQERVRILSDKALARIVTVEKDNYEADAIEFAEKELESRGITDYAPLLVDDPYEDLPSNYVRKFKEFDESGFSYSWSWAGFFFLYLWYFIKGMWAKGLILLAFSFIIFVLTNRMIFAPIVWLYCGIFGKWDYYLWKIKRKQLW